MGTAGAVLGRAVFEEREGRTKVAHKTTVVVFRTENYGPAMCFVAQSVSALMSADNGSCFGLPPRWALAGEKRRQARAEAVPERGSSMVRGDELWGS